MTDRELPITGPGAPPRSNGELVFADPWESRVFGAAVALDDVGAIPFARFQARLIDEIATWERAVHDNVDYRYYERWLEALERSVIDEGLATPAELAVVRERVAHERAHDHDHLHDRAYEHRHRGRSNE